ncbi:MAG: T9SS type A sorting domain-containing protein [Bacteroidota bacterium]|nr:T9SS type A sorting domain-containing protein [Bacteroidota bacterium]
MKKRIITTSVLSIALLLGINVLLIKKSDYVERQESHMAKLYSYMVPGGKKAAGMAEYLGAIRSNIETGTVSVSEYMEAIEQANNMNNSSKRVVNTIWKELGPDNVGGRTRAFLQDKDSPTLMFVGGVSGGLFRSTTRGTSWVPINDLEENLNISCIAQNTDGVIVYGTGEGQFVTVDGTLRGTPGFSGLGIFRSTDKGRSFTRVVASANYGNISSMDAETSGGTRIYASTDGGIRYSDDGLTWTMARNGSSKEVKVASNGDIYGQIGTNVLKSTDRGASWNNVNLPTTAFNRASIAISPEDPNYVYIMTSSTNSRLEGVYRSTDAGTTWTKIINSGSVYFDPLANALQGQGNFNNVITVNPKDKNHIIMGGVYLAEWKINTNPRYIASLNDFGGQNPSYVHADKHVLKWDMTTNPPTLIVGSDGGLSFSSNGLSVFNQKNFGFNATQFYYVAADYNGNVVGGTQDNGTQYINKRGNTEKSAVEIKSGDGFTSQISVKDNSKIFSSTYFGNITRSRDFGRTQSCIWDRRIARSFIGLAITDTSKYCEHPLQGNWAPFNTKFILWEHPDYENQESRMFFTRNGQIWMGIGVTDFQKEPEWYLIATNHGGSEVWDLEATNDGNSLFISNSSTIWRVDGLNSATYNPWSPELSIPAGITISNLAFNSGGRSITSVNLNPNDNDEALITVGNYSGTAFVYKGTSMLGTPSYTNITSNLPRIPVYDGIITYSNSNLYMVATDLGIYASDDGGANWTSQNTISSRFPRVPTLSLRQFYFPYKNQGAIYAGTHGRGFFECKQYVTNLNPISLNKKSIPSISAYPNPAQENVVLKFDSPIQETLIIKVMDLNGKIIFTQSYEVINGSNQFELNTSNIKSGVYIVTTEPTKPSTNSNKGILKLVIRH